MRRYTSVGHRDKAEPYFIAAHHAAGDSVLQISVKDGPDLVIGRAGTNHLVEVKSELANEKKDGYTRRTRGKLKPGQVAFSEAWKGGKVLVAFSPVESLAAVGHEPGAIQGALWDAGLHWLMDAHRGPEPTAAQWKKCKAKKCSHAASPNYRPPRTPVANAAAQAEETFAPPIQGLDLGQWAVTVRMTIGGTTVDVTGQSNEELAATAARLVNESAERSTLKCQRLGCAHTWDEHTHSDAPVPKQGDESCAGDDDDCLCTGYMGPGPASLHPVGGKP